MLVRCGNCGRVYVPETGGITPLGQVAHLHERLEPGDEVPYGECDACGAFVYLVIPHTSECPNALLPDGPICPRCGGPRAPSGVDGGSWVHFPRSTPATADLGLVQKSPITGHTCFLGPMCDLWHRTDSVTITCGSCGPPPGIPTQEVYPCGHPRIPGDDICSGLYCNLQLLFE